MFAQFMSFVTFFYESVPSFVSAIVNFLSYQPIGLGGLTILQLLITTGIGTFLGITIGKWIIGID